LKMEGYNSVETGEKLGISSITVRRHLQDAIKRLNENDKSIL